MTPHRVDGGRSVPPVGQSRSPGSGQSEDRSFDLALLLATGTLPAPDFAPRSTPGADGVRSPAPNADGGCEEKRDSRAQRTGEATGERPASSEPAAGSHRNPTAERAASSARGDEPELRGTGEKGPRAGEPTAGRGDREGPARPSGSMAQVPAEGIAAGLRAMATAASPRLPAGPVAEVAPVSKATGTGTPAGLGGQVTLTLSGEAGTEGRVRLVLRGATLHATILVEDGATSRRLGQGLSELREALRDRGFPDANLSVQNVRAAEGKPQADASKGTRSQEGEREWKQERDRQGGGRADGDRPRRHPSVPSEPTEER